MVLINPVAEIPDVGSRSLRTGQHSHLHFHLIDLMDLGGHMGIELHIVRMSRQAEGKNQEQKCFHTSHQATVMPVWEMQSLVSK